MPPVHSLQPSPARRRRGRARGRSLDLFESTAGTPATAPTAAAPAPAPAARATLWLCLRLPRLALEVFSRGQPAAGPAVVASGRGREQRVAVCSPAAEALGVRAGMRLGAAHALGALQVFERDRHAEQAALTALALWAGQFTPWLSLLEGEGLLLEVRGSLKLFGGARALIEQARMGCRELGYEPCLSLAPTPTAALLFARAGRAICCTDPARLAGPLSRLPLAVLGLPEPQQRALRDMGLSRVGELLRLPRDGLARRLSPALLQALDRALGRAPDPRPNFQPPGRFEARLELAFECRSTAPLLFAARRLLTELAGFLRARGAGTQTLLWTLEHERVAGHTAPAPPARAEAGAPPGAVGQGTEAPPPGGAGAPGPAPHATPSARPGTAPHTCLHLGLVAPNRDAEHLLELTRERLERLHSGRPVQALCLRVDSLAPLAPQAATLPRLQEPGAAEQALAPLIERLRARLGTSAVRGLAAVSDHRPERAWRHCEPATSPRAAAAAAGPPAEAWTLRRRPLWLLPEPRPLRVRDGRPECDGPLRAESGPERIESGWWEGSRVARDYYVVVNPLGERFWIYRALQAPECWFLHGVFE